MVDPNRADPMLALLEEAGQVMPGGVCASARFNPCLGHPLFAERADGARVYGIDGRDYIDFNLSHGALFLGHNHPAVKQAIEQAIESGIYCGYETEYHSQLARVVVKTIPCAEQIRLVNTGSEGTQTLLRLARAFTGKKKLLKFWGHFHGLYDYVMYNAHGPAEPRRVGPYIRKVHESAGIPPELDDLVIVVPWKDEAALEQAVREHGDEIAAIMMEPINYNAGCIIPSREYMQFVRKLCSDNGILLIYDEVLSAFRTGPDCGQGYFGVTPDLCVLGKAVANGGPLAIMAGRAEIMRGFAPVGHVAHSGTFTGNLIAVKMALASFAAVTEPGFYDRIYASADHFYDCLNELFARHGVPARAQGLGARFGLFFGFRESVEKFEDTFKNDDALTAHFIRACAGRGVYFHHYGSMSTGHHGLSAAHTLPVVDEALNRIEDALLDMTGRR